MSSSSRQARKNGAVISPLITCLGAVRRNICGSGVDEDALRGHVLYFFLASRPSASSSHTDSPSTTLDVICNTYSFRGYPSTGGWDSKESACSAGDPGTIPILGRSPGEGNGNPLQYSCLENSTDRGAWQDTVQGVAGADTTEWLTLTILISQSRTYQYFTSLHPVTIITSFFFKKNRKLLCRSIHRILFLLCFLAIYSSMPALR